MGIICILDSTSDLSIKEVLAKGKCGKHHYEIPEKGYIQYHAEAEARHKRGEKQFCCPVCGLWLWNAYKIKPLPGGLRK